MATIPPRCEGSSSATGCTASTTASIATGHSATRGGATVEEATGVNPARENLSATWKYPREALPAGTGSEPVVNASRSTAGASASEGRFSTHSRVRNRFCAVLDRAPSPSMARQPSQNAEDIGARFGEPSSLELEIRTTGVPKYRMPGSMAVCARVFTPKILPRPNDADSRKSAVAITGTTTGAGDRDEGSAGQGPPGQDPRQMTAVLGRRVGLVRGR